MSRQTHRPVRHTGPVRHTIPVVHTIPVGHTSPVGHTGPDRQGPASRVCPARPPARVGTTKPAAALVTGQMGPWPTVARQTLSLPPAPSMGQSGWPAPGQGRQRPVALLERLRPSMIASDSYTRQWYLFRYLLFSVPCFFGEKLSAN